MPCPLLRLYPLLVPKPSHPNPSQAQRSSREISVGPQCGDLAQNVEKHYPPLPALSMCPASSELPPPGRCGRRGECEVGGGEEDHMMKQARQHTVGTPGRVESRTIFILSLLSSP